MWRSGMHVNLRKCRVFKCISMDTTHTPPPVPLDSTFNVGILVVMGTGRVPLSLRSMTLLMKGAWPIRPVTVGGCRHRAPHPLLPRHQEATTGAQVCTVLYSSFLKGQSLKILVANATLLNLISHTILMVVFSLFCRADTVVHTKFCLRFCLVGVGLMWTWSLFLHWSRIDEFVLGLKSVDELCHSHPMGTGNADANQPSKGGFAWTNPSNFQVTQPGSTTVTPLHQ
jgi:hypothetical protein